MRTILCVIFSIATLKAAANTSCNVHDKTFPSGIFCASLSYEPNACGIHEINTSGIIGNVDDTTFAGVRFVDNQSICDSAGGTKIQNVSSYKGCGTDGLPVPACYDRL